MIKNDTAITNAVTIDVEEWFDTILFAEEPAFASRKSGLPANVSDILALLAGASVKATFFILGSVARKYPDTVKAIAAAGHEVASHGGTHKAVFRMSPAEFKKDLADSRADLERLSGQTPQGYRAPTISILKNDSVHLSAIREAGYTYDSSLYPVFLSRRPAAPYSDACGLVEFPPSVFSLAGVKMPFLGGTFLRLLPLCFTTARLAALNARSLPGMLYFHSWEFEKARPAGAGLTAAAGQFLNSASVPRKVAALLRDFSFAPARLALELYDRSGAKPGKAAGGSPAPGRSGQ